MMIFYYLLALFIIALDQLTKYAVVIYMDIGESIELIPDFLYLTSHRNEGAAFGILQGQMWFFYIITVVVVAAIIYHLHKYGKTSIMIGLPLVLILGERLAISLTGYCLERSWISWIRISGATAILSLT